jgi:hypothetical protein
MAKKQNILKDWFGRRAEDSFTSKGARRLSAWDTGRSNYSSFFVKDNTSLEVAAKMVGSMFRVVNVPKEIKYTTGNPNDKKKMQIPVAMLKDEDGNFSDHDLEKLDAFYGKSIQNAALATMQTGYEYGKTLNSMDTSKKGYNMKDFLFSILNTERIDKKLGDRLPGYLKFVQKYKDYTFDKNYEPLDEDEKPQKRLLDLITRMLRYPAHITEEEMAEFEKPMKQMERLIKKFNGLPSTSDECSSMASSLANIVYKFVEEEEEPPGGGGDDGEGGGEGDDDMPGGGSSGSSKSPMSKSDLDDFAKEMSESIMSDESDGGSDEEEALKEFEESMEDTSPSKEFNYDDSSESGGIGMEDVYFKKSDTRTSNKSTYMRVVKNIDSTKAAVLRKLFARKSKDYQFTMKSMRSGRLDTNKLAEAVQNVPTIYERYGQVKTDKICVGVLIDESGSMSGTKIQKAREAAVFINEVFKTSREVQLYIYGHTADIRSHCSTDMMIYREPGYQMDPYALAAVEARSQNRDGTAILATAKRIRKYTKDQGILFVISDGAPAASGYGGSSGIKDTREKVLKAQALGFQVIQIAIESHVPSQEMFDYFVKMTDIKNLPRDLVSYMSRKVDKLVKERISI